MICQSDSGTGTLTVSQGKRNPLSYANSHKNWDDTPLKESPLGFRSHRFAHLWKIYPALWNLFVLFMLFQVSGVQDSSGFKEDQMRKNEEMLPCMGKQAFLVITGSQWNEKVWGDFLECDGKEGTDILKQVRTKESCPWKIPVTRAGNLKSFSKCIISRGSMRPQNEIRCTKIIPTALPAQEQSLLRFSLARMPDTLRKGQQVLASIKDIFD